MEKPSVKCALLATMISVAVDRVEHGALELVAGPHGQVERGPLGVETEVSTDDVRDGLHLHFAFRSARSRRRAMDQRFDPTKERSTGTSEIQ